MYKNNNYSIKGTFRFYQHCLILAIIAVIILVIFMWRPISSLSDSELLSGITSAVPVLDADTVFSDDTIELTDETDDDNTLGEDDDDQDNVSEYTVVDGDTLLRVLMQFGIDKSDIYLISRQHKQLTNLKIGQKISWENDEEHRLQSLTWYVSQREVRNYVREGNKFVLKKDVREGTWEPVVIAGTISSGSFSVSGKSVGLTTREISQIIKALQWQFNFRKLQRNDKFIALISREILNGKHENSELLGVRLKSAGRDYYAIGFTDGRFYNRDGRGGGGLERGFSRYPLARTAPISSHFNPVRLNPVTRRVTPHNGVDFAVITGTPVLATGDGEVITAQYSNSAGYYVVIEHGRQFISKFMHLSKILVKPGQKVKKGDRVALSGNTGRSTGPHLHYEFHINKKPVNPVTVNLPRSDGLTGKARLNFLEKSKEVVKKLKL